MSFVLPLKKTLLPIGIIIVAVLCMFALLNMKSKPEEIVPERKPVLIDVLTVSKKTITHQLNSQGSIEPLLNAQLSAQVSGQIVYLSEHFVEGAKVKKQDVLIRLDDSDYKTDLLTAQANLAQAKAKLEEELAQADVAKAEWAALFEQATDLALRKPQVKQAQAHYRSAQASVERAQRNLERTEIKAPFDGIVVHRGVDLGQFVNTSMVLGEIYGTEIAEIRLPLSQYQALFIDMDALNQGALNTPVAFQYKVANRVFKWQGYLHRSEALIDSENRMYYVIARIDDPYNYRLQHDSTLHFGRFVEAKLSGITQDDIVVLPRDLLIGQNQLVVINAEQKVELRAVEILRADDHYVYIAKGLNEGELIATTAISSPIDGMPVRIVSKAGAE